VELEKLRSVGTVTVTPAATSNRTTGSGCSWRVTFETNTGSEQDGGRLPRLEMSLIKGSRCPALR